MLEQIAEWLRQSTSAVAFTGAGISTESGITKHATVSFGQALPQDVLEESWRLSQAADLFMTLGSSLVVQPAASLPAIAKQNGARLVIINRDSTPLDGLADAVLNASIGETLAAIDRELLTYP